MAYGDIWHKLVTSAFSALSKALKTTVKKKNEIPYHKIMKYLFYKELKKEKKNSYNSISLRFV